MSQKPSSRVVYLIIFGSLLVLTGLTVWVAYQPLGGWHTPIALTIAVTKTTLVVLFFMHVLHSTRLVSVVIFSAVFMFALLWSLTLIDYYTRGWLKPV